MHHNIKILMAAEGSDQSLNAVRYLAGTFPATRTEVVLFHVRSSVPESVCDLKKDTNIQSIKQAISEWENQTQKSLEGFMLKAKDILTDAGFPEKAVTFNIQPKKIGVARDIFKESFNGYHAVVMGRKSANTIKAFVIGSVADKLVRKIPHLPVVVVGGAPDPKKILVGFDGSEEADKAVSAIAEMIDPENCSITLCHIIRQLGMNLTGDFRFTSGDEREWTDQAKKTITPLIKAAKNRLVAAGFYPEMIFDETLEEEASRANKLVKTAMEAGIGTIVVGRRGLTVVEEFVLGRVSTKVLNMAQDMAVWIA